MKDKHGRKYVLINTKGLLSWEKGTTTQGASAQRFDSLAEAQAEAKRRNFGGDPDNPEWEPTLEMFADPELYPEAA